MTIFKIYPELLYSLPAETHTTDELIRILNNHPERIIPENLTAIRDLVAYHNPQNPYDEAMWKEINKIKNRLAKDTQDYVFVFTEIRLAIDARNLKELSRLQQSMSAQQTELLTRYSEYCQNQI